jgi:hypothetical protein
LAEPDPAALAGGVTLRSERGFELLLGDRAVLDENFAEAAAGSADGWWVHPLLFGRKFTRIE